MEEEDTPGGRGCRGYLKRCWDLLRRNAFVISCLAAVVLGVVLGSIFKLYIKLSEDGQLYITFPGEMLLRMIEMITIPLIVSSVITGCSGLVGIPAKVAARASAYFVSTTLLSMALGLILVLSIKPGVDTVRKEDAEDEDLFSLVDALMDLAWNIAPENLNLVYYRQYKTEMVEFEIGADEQRFSLETNATEVQLVHHDLEGTNILAVIVWSCIFGLALNRTTQSSDFLLEQLTVLNETAKHAVNLILCYVPFALVFMVTSIILEVDDWEILVKLGKFMGVVVFGLVIHGLLVLPLIYFLCVRRNPYAVIKGVFPALMTAFVSSSSSATLPLTFKCCEERLQINKRISRFMLPIETNFNMNGTVLYEVVAAVFIAQLNSIHLDLNQWIAIALTSAVSSLGSAGIPDRGAVTTLFVLTAVGLPAKEACILVFVECLLDRCNTVVNVMGDCFGVALLHQVSKTDLEDTEQGQEMERINVSVAEAQTPDEIQVHISSQASDDDTINTPPKTHHSNTVDEGQTKEDIGVNSYAQGAHRVHFQGAQAAPGAQGALSK